VWFPELDWCPKLFCSEKLPELRLIAIGDTRVTTLNAFGTDSTSGQVVVDGVRRVPDAVVPLPHLDPVLTGSASLPLAYHIEGRPDLGTVTRHVQVDSPQLTAPLTTEFRITTKRHPLLIVVLAAVGLIAGLLVRTVLVRLRDRAAEVERAGVLAVELRRLRDRHTDPTLRGEIDDALRTLAGIKLWHRGGTESLKTTIDAVRTTVDAALQVLATATKSVRERLTPIETDLRVDWQLPTELHDLVRAALGRIDRIDALLEAGNPTEAGRELESLVESCMEIKRKAGAHVVHVSMEAGALADKLAATTGPLKSVQTAAAELARTAPLPADTALRDALRAAHRAETDRASLIAGLRTAVTQTIESAQPTLRDEAQAAAEPLLRLADRGSLAEIANALPAFLAELKRIGVALGTTGAIAVVAPSEEPGGPSTRPRPDTPVEQVPPVARQIVATSLALGSEMLRLLLLGALISVLAYGVFGGDWTGTFAQMVAVFSWAFVVDISVEAVRTAMPTAPNPP
jgi:hypothetical protein